MLLLTGCLTLVVSGQKPDSYDTLSTRGEHQLLVPVYDTIKQLEDANLKADSLLLDLKMIKCKLGLLADTNKPK